MVIQSDVNFLGTANTRGYVYMSEIQFIFSRLPVSCLLNDKLMKFLKPTSSRFGALILIVISFASNANAALLLEF